MAQRKSKPAVPVPVAPGPKPRGTKKSAWAAKVVAQAFTSLVAPLLVGLSLQCLQATRSTPTPKAADAAEKCPLRAGEDESGRGEKGGVTRWVTKSAETTKAGQTP